MFYQKTKLNAHHQSMSNQIEYHWNLPHWLTNAVTPFRHAVIAGMNEHEHCIPY